MKRTLSGRSDLPGGGFPPQRPSLRPASLGLIVLVVVATLTVYYSGHSYLYTSPLWVPRITDIPPAPPSPTDLPTGVPWITPPTRCNLKPSSLAVSDFVAPKLVADLNLDTSQTWSSPSHPLPLVASLKDRTDSWLASPLAPYDVWTTFNQLTCGTQVTEKNVVKSSSKTATYRLVDGDTAGAMRKELVAALEVASEQGRLDVPESAKGKRGIVLLGGDQVRSMAPAALSYTRRC